MRIVIQRVTHATLSIDGIEHCNIGHGMVVLVGFEPNDNDEDIEWTASKLAKLRIFADSEGVMNHSVDQVAGEIMVVSQFTLMASTRKGNRPSYIRAAQPPIAVPLYEQFLTTVAQMVTRPICSGVFGADMQIELVNDGPVTIIIDSKNRE